MFEINNELNIKCSDCELDNNLKDFKNSLRNLNLSELSDIEKEIIKNKNLIKLNLLRNYIHENFDKKHYC